MPANVRQISVLGCLLLVLLRISIGWQFLYEGLWKWNTQATAKPWSAEGYLVNARGPFRDYFRSLVDDPNGLDKLDYDKVTANWDAWRSQFVKLHPDLSEEQRTQLDEFLVGPEEFVQPLAALPKEVDLEKFKPVKYKPADGWYLRFNPEKKRLETNLHLIPEERDALLKLVEAKASPDGSPPAKLSDAGRKFQEAVRKLYDRTGKLSLKERLQILLKEDPSRVGVILDAQQGTIDPQRPGKNQEYLHLLARYEENLKRARQSFQQEHLAKQWEEVYKLRVELTAPVDGLTTEMKTFGDKLLTIEQAQRGPVAEAHGKTARINHMTMWSLMTLGMLLMVGLFSRASALCAAGLLLMFYLPMPPWPGVPEPPGPEHALFINKNLIEVFACLGLVAIPTGRWLGLDALVRRFLLFRKTD
ncbi:MAG: hypothetical protein ACKV0T_10935 [Planctomycetales bacterium]